MQSREKEYLPFPEAAGSQVEELVWGEIPRVASLRNTSLYDKLLNLR